MGCYYMGKSSKANFLKAKKYFPLRVILLALGFIIVCILGIPTGIHWLFKQNATCDFFQAEWDAGDVLSFYGALLAAASTISWRLSFSTSCPKEVIEKMRRDGYALI